MTKHSLPFLNEQDVNPAFECIPAQDLFLSATRLLLQEKLFLQKDLKLETLCNLLGVTPYAFGKALRHHEFCNFSSFVNHFRVEEAKTRMASSEYDMYTLEAIAEMAGFGTRQAFYNAFEKMTGMKPARYKRMVKSGERA